MDDAKIKDKTPVFRKMEISLGVGDLTNEYHAFSPVLLPQSICPVGISHNHVTCCNQRNVSISHVCHFQVESTCETSPFSMLCVPAPANPKFGEGSVTKRWNFCQRGPWSNNCDQSPSADQCRKRRGLTKSKPQTIALSHWDLGVTCPQQHNLASSN